MKTDCKVSFAIYDKNTGNPAIVSPAEVVGKVEGTLCLKSQVYLRRRSCSSDDPDSRSCQ